VVVEQPRRHGGAADDGIDGAVPQGGIAVVYVVEGRRAYVLGLQLFRQEIGVAGQDGRCLYGAAAKGGDLDENAVVVDFDEAQA
jgi:hypothetical protein